MRALLFIAALALLALALGCRAVVVGPRGAMVFSPARVRVVLPVPVVVVRG